eukprot:5128040-Prymnesium_polylepis.1
MYHHPSGNSTGELRKKTSVFGAVSVSGVLVGTGALSMDLSSTSPAPKHISTQILPESYAHHIIPGVSPLLGPVVLEPLSPTACPLAGWFGLRTRVEPPPPGRADTLAPHVAIPR